MSMQRPCPEFSARSGLYCSALAFTLAVPIIGSFVLGVHALGIVLLPALVPMILKVPQLRTLWLVAMLWAIGQTLSTVVNGGEITAAVGFVGLLVALLVSVLWWVHDVEGVGRNSVALAVAVGWIGWALGASDWLTTENPWKYQLAPPTLMLLLVWACIRKWSLGTVTTCMLGFSLVSLWADARFYVLLGLFVAALTLYQSGSRKGSRNGRSSSASSRRVAVAGAAAVALLFVVYPYVAVSGILGDRARVQQLNYNASGTHYLVENRAESLQALYIVSNSPLLGIGAKQALSPGVTAETLTWLDRVGVEMSPARAAYLTDAAATKQGYSPHSGLLTTLVQAGLSAIFFWVYSLGIVARRLMRYQDSASSSALHLSLAGVVLWNAFFSPLDVAAYLALAAALFVALSSDRQGAKDVSEVSDSELVSVRCR